MKKINLPFFLVILFIPLASAAICPYRCSTIKKFNCTNHTISSDGHIKIQVFNNHSDITLFEDFQAKGICIGGGSIESLMINNTRLEFPATIRKGESATISVNCGTYWKGTVLIRLKLKYRNGSDTEDRFLPVTVTDYFQLPEHPTQTQEIVRKKNWKYVPEKLLLPLQILCFLVLACATAILLRKARSEKLPSWIYAFPALFCILFAAFIFLAMNRTNGCPPMPMTYYVVLLIYLVLFILYLITLYVEIALHRRIKKTKEF